MKLITKKTTDTVYTITLTENELRILLCALGRASDNVLKGSAAELGIFIDPDDTIGQYNDMKRMLGLA
jgi:hypothetical protein